MTDGRVLKVKVERGGMRAIATIKTEKGQVYHLRVPTSKAMDQLVAQIQKAKESPHWPQKKK